MRFVGGLLAVALALSPAIAQTAKPKPPAARPSAAKPQAAKPAKPAPAAAARAGYASLSDLERMTIQSDLIWTGDYNGVIAADMSDRAIAGVKGFQKRHGARETGILTADERQKLSQEAEPRQESAGWRLVADTATGAWLGLPARLVPQASAAKAGSHWQSARGETQVDTFRITGTTLAAAFERLRKEPAERRVEYNVMRGDFFVISGLQGLKKFYVRAQVKDEEVRGITILYDQALEGIMDPVTVAMSNAFMPFPVPGAPTAGLMPPGPPPRPKVEYASGIVASAAGHIVTDREAVEECQTIQVGGLGPAERIAEDRTAGLALLRVYGARELTPAAIGGDAVQGPGVTLLGVADPQQQGGGDAVTTLSAQLVQSEAARALEPAPAAGFSGSAAFDSEARLIGMVGLRQRAAAAGAPRAALVPADLIRTFLYAQSVAPSSVRTSLADAKAAIVRVICVRR